MVYPYIMVFDLAKWKTLDAKTREQIKHDFADLETHADALIAKGADDVIAKFEQDGKAVAAFGSLLIKESRGLAAKQYDLYGDSVEGGKELLDKALSVYGPYAL